MRWFFIAFISLTLSLSTSVFADDDQEITKETRNKLNNAGDQFMSLLKTGKTEQAYKDLLIAVGGDSERLQQQATEVASFMLKVREQLGNPIAYDLIDTDHIKTHFFKQIYLLKFDNAAIVWEINYYQPSNGWKLVDVAYNTDIDALFDD